MARPLKLVVEEMLDYIEQASSYVASMTFEQYSSDRKTQRAVERCIEVISEASRHIPVPRTYNRSRSGSRPA
jgi:uncharacterized protein with HEPN domain